VRKEELACIIVEPVMGAAGFIPAEKEFLKGLKELCEDKNALLIFDEVITGFRFFKGAQNFYNVKPDLTTLGKAVGGQYFPGAGAFCGKAEIMEKLNQIKNKNFWERVFHGGTYTGNALTMRMGYELITNLEREGFNFYNRIDKLGEEIRNELKNIFEERKVKAYVTGLNSLLAIHFTNKKPINGLTAEEAKIKVDLKKDYKVKNTYELGLKIRKWLIDFMSSGPVVKIALEGPQAVMVVRKLVGKTVPFLADPGTIRGDFSIDNPLLANLERRPIKNLIHASGNKKEAEYELKLWFKKSELL